jgi:hypothetical protein
LDRRTDRPDGSGGGSPTVVTSRATGDDLVGDEQDAQPSGIMAPPRRSSQKPTAAKSAPAKSGSPDDAVSDGTPGAGPVGDGAPAGGNGIDGAKDASVNGGKDARPNGSPAAMDAAFPAVADATPGGGVPALPADSIGAVRGTKPKGHDPDRETPASKAGEQSRVDDSPAYSFGPPPAAPARPARAAADPAESAVKPSGDDGSPSVFSPAAFSRTAPPGTGPSSAGPSSVRPSGAAPSGRSSSSVPSAPTEPPSVSPAAFAWEMPDPPPNSPSSPARTFLRSGTTGKGTGAATAASSASPGQTSPSTASPSTASPSPGKAGASKAATGEGPVTMRNAPQKPQKGQSRRNARQAHLTVARVEPWSVMKFSFVVSLVAFVILFVAVIVLYSVLSGLGVFDSLQRVVTSVTSSQGSAGVNAKAWFSESKVLGYTALLGSLNIVLITAMSTIGSVVYNLTSRLVSGVEVTLRETE